jgi:pyruvate, orthophosphate dikinase
LRLGALDEDAQAADLLQELIGVQEPIGRGIAAATRVAVGRAAFDSANAERLAGGGEPIILVRPDTNTADVSAFSLSQGIVTAVGGRTAHAALVARQMGKPCMVGCMGLDIDAVRRNTRLAGSVVNEGDWLSIDGGTGMIFLGRGKIAIDRPEAELAQIERWRNQTLART